MDLNTKIMLGLMLFIVIVTSLPKSNNDNK